LVPVSARRILDLGCSSGALGAALKAEREVEVVGVEISEEYASRAEARLDRVVRADLEELAASPGLRANLGEFDCLIAADVLEHTADPWSCLAGFGGLLKPGGTAIVSLPNVRFWETFWELGRHGTWPRRPQGIFDRTHLRWFTVADGIALIESAGLEVTTIQRQFRTRRNKLSNRPFARGLGRTPLRPFVTFQFAIVAKRPPDG